MVFTNLEELKAAVADRRQSVLTLEIDLGGVYSEEHEQAKKELATAEGMKLLMQQGSGGGFLNGDSNIEHLRQRVAETKPETPSIWIQFSKLDLEEWRNITKRTTLDQFEQYEQVLPKTFLGLYGEDPDPEEKPEGWVKPEPLTKNPLSVSSRGGAEALLPGGSLASVVQNYMVWQNSGGDVTIRPTKSGLV